VSARAAGDKPAALSANSNPALASKRSVHIRVFVLRIW